MRNTELAYKEPGTGLVYSLSTVKFPSPAKVISAPVVIFTSWAHKYTSLLTRGISKLSKGVYYPEAGENEFALYEKKMVEARAKGKESFKKAMTKQSLRSKIIKIKDEKSCLKAIEFFSKSKK